MLYEEHVFVFLIDASEGARILIQSKLTSTKLVIDSTCNYDTGEQLSSNNNNCIQSACRYRFASLSSSHLRVVVCYLIIHCEDPADIGVFPSSFDMVEKRVGNFHASPSRRVLGSYENVVSVA